MRGSGRERLTCEAVSVYVSVTDHEFWPVSDTASLMQNTLTVTVWPAAPTCVTAVTTAKFAANVHFHRLCRRRFLCMHHAEPASSCANQFEEIK